MLTGETSWTLLAGDCRTAHTKEQNVLSPSVSAMAVLRCIICTPDTNAARRTMEMGHLSGEI